MGVGAEQALPRFVPLPTTGEAQSSMYEPYRPQAPSRTPPRWAEDVLLHQPQFPAARGEEKRAVGLTVVSLGVAAILAVIGLLALAHSYYVEEPTVFDRTVEWALRPFQEPDASDQEAPGPVASAEPQAADQPAGMDTGAAPETSGADSVSTPQPEATPEPAAPSTPEPTASSARLAPVELGELRQLALGLINQDRAARGLPPVALGTNPAAQLHAEDMLEHSYLGHWWVDGRKPYMVYSETGGSSYAHQNAASDGWTDERWEEEGCGRLWVSCIVPNPAEAIADAQWAMMYDDAHADWGHRDNILGKDHWAVNIGIGWNGRRVTFVQHFEGGDAQALRPTMDGSLLLLNINRIASGVEVAPLIGVYYDPPPTAKAPERIDALDSYCTGGGFTAKCGEAIARILEPPPAGTYYRDLEPNDVIASVLVRNADIAAGACRLGGPCRRARRLHRHCLARHRWQRSFGSAH